MQKQMLQRFVQTAREMLQTAIKHKMKENATDEDIQALSYAAFYRLFAYHYLEQNGYLKHSLSKDIKLVWEDLQRLHPQAFVSCDPIVQQICEDHASDFSILMGEYLSPKELRGRPEIIGWMHQYYHAPQKIAAFANRNSSKKIKDSDLIAATQLFTPDWLSAYLVQNSIGKLTDCCTDRFSYHIPELSQNKAMIQSLMQNRPDRHPSSFTVFDPCMGSGHLLCAAFDVLMQIYQAHGVDTKQAIPAIFAHNLYGLDIDETVSAVCNLQVLMKACCYDPDILYTPMQTHMLAVIAPPQLGQTVSTELTAICLAFSDAPLAGSLLVLPDYCSNKLRDEIAALTASEVEKQKLLAMLDTADILSMQYDVVLTNPPYMGKKNLHPALAQYLALHYPIGKSELYAAFMLRCLKWTKQAGFTAMVTVHTWMFLRSFAPLRKKLLSETTLSTMLHTGAGSFDELSAFNVLATAFCLRKLSIPGYLSQIVYLGEYSNTEQKKAHFTDPAHRYLVDQNQFAQIPGMPFVYRISANAIRQFSQSPPLGAVAKPKQGMATADNARFVRYWFEVNPNDICYNAADAQDALISQKRFFPYNKGGFYRKWYGMNEYVVDYQNDGALLKSFDRAVLRNCADYFKSGITWSLFGFENFGVRYKPNGFIFDVSGSSMFPKQELCHYILAFLCSKVSFLYLSVLAPTVNFQVGNIADLPFILDDQIKPEIDTLAKECIAIAKADWDDFEASWDYKCHPFMRYGQGNLLADRYAAWEETCFSRYTALKQKEERINTLFIALYGLQQDITPEVCHRDISVKLAEQKRDVCAFLSYAVGSLLGRYGEGKCHPMIVFDSPYADNGIMTLFEKWLCQQFGKAFLEQNLSFLANAIASSGDAREILCHYFTRQFYFDHVTLYQKHPIYFMFDSGKTHAFLALFSMHRYQPAFLSDAIKQVGQRLQTASAMQRKELEAYLKMLQNAVNDDIQIDPNDGVWINHGKVNGLLTVMKSM